MKTVCCLSHEVTHGGSRAELPRLISPLLRLPERPRTQDISLVLCVTSTPHARKNETLAGIPDKQSRCQQRLGRNGATQPRPLQGQLQEWGWS